MNHLSYQTGGRYPWHYSKFKFLIVVRIEFDIIDKIVIKLKILAKTAELKLLIQLITYT